MAIGRQTRQRAAHPERRSLAALDWCAAHAGRTVRVRLARLAFILSVQAWNSAARRVDAPRGVRSGHAAVIRAAAGAIQVFVTVLPTRTRGTHRREASGAVIE